MAIVMIKPDCTDSPRSLFLKDLHIAFAHGNTQRLKELLPNNIVWLIVGRKRLGTIERHKINEKVTRCKMQELIEYSGMVCTRYSGITCTSHSGNHEY